MWAGPCSSECPPAIPLVLSEVPCRVFLLKDPFLLYHMVIIFFFQFTRSFSHVVTTGYFSPAQRMESSYEGLRACLSQQKAKLSFWTLGHLPQT